MALEEEFGLDIPDEDADKLKTVGDAMNYLKQHATRSTGRRGRARIGTRPARRRDPRGADRGRHLNEGNA